MRSKLLRHHHGADSVLTPDHRTLGVAMSSVLLLHPLPLLSPSSWPRQSVRSTPTNRSRSGPAPGGGNFVIDVIHYRQGSGGLNNEYLRVKNTSQQRRVLTNFRIVDASDGQRYTFPRTTVRPGHRVTLFTGRGNDSPGKRYWDVEHRPGTTTATPPGWSTRPGP